MSRMGAVVHSAVWAAYGDALGYITELADLAKVRRRTGRSHIGQLMEWTRDLPGRPPVSVKFPLGTYSDDTQLRLATGRAIRADGRFDVAAFAKVELPSWTNYALGAGISSKEAAFSLAKASTHWYSNFFDTKRADYRNGGGNGAAMRIQPHVWAAPVGTHHKAILRDVIRNAICTHGHPRGIIGAAFHALCLHFYLVEERVANIGDLHDLALVTEECWEIIEADPDLRLFWIPQLTADADPRERFSECVFELTNDIEKLRTLGGPGASYLDALKRIDLFDQGSRGSGTKTALAAAWLAWQFQDRGVHAALVEAANALESDTDTIGTMAGALMGCLAKSLPEEPVQDAEYIISEAERLWKISVRQADRSFGYPDLRSYKPPKNAVDAVFADGANYVVAGLGNATPMADFVTRGDQSGDLRWLRLHTGQTILAHIRQEPRLASETTQQLFQAARSLFDERRLPAPNARRDSGAAIKVNAGSRAAPVQSSDPPNRPLSIDQLASAIIDNDHNATELGAAILKLASGPDEHYLERVVSLSAIVARSYRRRGVKR